MQKRPARVRNQAPHAISLTAGGGCFVLPWCRAAPAAALLDEPSFYTEGFHGYIKWSATDSLSDLMHWCRIVKPEAFKIYYASTSLLEVPKKK